MGTHTGGMFRKTASVLPVAAALFLTLLLSPGLCAGAEGDEILGLWATEKTENGYSHIRISREGDLYHGEIVWLDQPNFPPDDDQGMAGLPKVDRENPDPALKDRPIIGLKIIQGFRYAKKGEWKEGRIYDPENGKTYKSKMKLAGEGELKVRGFIGISLLGRTTRWTRPPGE